MGRIYSNLLWVSLPAVLALIVEPLAGMIDTALIGHKDTQWLGAMGLCVAVFNSIGWVFNFLVHTVTARIGQAVGKGDRNQVSRDIGLAIAFAFCLGLIAAVTCGFLKSFILQVVMGASETVYALAEPYYDWRVYSLPLVLVASAMMGTLRGIQRIGQSFVLIAAATLTNAVVTYLLVYCAGWGLKGAGIGTLCGYLVGVVWGGGYMIFYIRQQGLPFTFRFPKDNILEFGAESLNMFWRSAALTGAFFSMAAVAGHFGVLEVAAHQVVYQVWIMASFIVDGFCITGTAMGAKLLGEGKRNEFLLLGQRLGVLAITTGILFSVVCGLFPQSVIGVFSNDTAVFHKVMPFWWLVILAQPFNAVVYIYDGMFFGSRDFQFLRQKMLEGVVLVFIPIILLSVFVTESLFTVWLAMAGLGLYRLIAGSFRFFSKDYPYEMS